MKLLVFLSAALLLLGTVVVAEGTPDDGLQKKQGGGDTCQDAQVTSCQNALNSHNNERYCDGNCMEVLTEYYKCLGFKEVRIYRDEECGAADTAVGYVVFILTLLVAFMVPIMS